jgi:hypothetical protein
VDGDRELPVICRWFRLNHADRRRGHRHYLLRHR